MELKQLMVDFLSKTLGKSNEEINGLLFQKADDGALTDELSETAFQSLTELHAAHLASIRDDAGQDQYNEGHKAGKFEALNKAEEEIRKAYGLEGKGKLKELITEAVSKASTLTEDKVQTHPLYVAAFQKWEEEKAALIEEKEKTVSEIKAQVERQQRFSQVAPTIDEALLKAGVSADFLKPAAKKAFLSQFEGKDFEVTETGTYIKGPDGKLMKDALGHPLKLETFVSQAAPEWFPIEKQPGRQSPGNDPTNPPKPAKWTKDNVPKTFKEFEAVYSTLEGQEAKEFVAAFEAANNPAAAEPV